MRTNQILKITFSIACIELLLFSAFGFQPGTKPSSGITNMQHRAYAQNGTIEEFPQEPTAADLNGTIEEFPQEPTAA